jgi:hypothetical protein
MRGRGTSLQFLLENDRLKGAIGGADAAFDSDGDINRVLIRPFLDCMGFAPGSAGAALIALVCYNVGHAYLSWPSILIRDLGFEMKSRIPNLESFK